VPPRDALLTWLPRLRRYARALARDRDDADDLVQDTLERAWARSSLWPDVGDMRAWLFSVMHNLHLDGRRRHRLELLADDGTPPDVPVAATQGDRLAVRDLQAALDRLPHEQKAVILLVALEDMTYAEVADTLGVPIGTVMSRLSRGRDRLRTLMDGTPDTHRPAVGLKVVK
jgi:RNA polymerase sigma factor (sigma-70 family)